MLKLRNIIPFRRKAGPFSEVFYGFVPSGFLLQQFFSILVEPPDILEYIYVMKRTIVKINEARCIACGECVPACPEGALQMHDGTSQLASDQFCDGRGACIRSCPRGAISIEEREAAAYSEHLVMEERVVPGGRARIALHLEHLRLHGETGRLEEATAFLEKRGFDV